MTIYSHHKLDINMNINIMSKSHYYFQAIYNNNKLYRTTIFIIISSSLNNKHFHNYLIIIYLEKNVFYFLKHLYCYNGDNFSDHKLYITFIKIIIIIQIIITFQNDIFSSL